MLTMYLKLENSFWNKQLLLDFDYEIILLFCDIWCINVDRYLSLYSVNGQK